MIPMNCRLLAVHRRSKQFVKVLDVLRRGLELRPESDRFYFLLSKMYGALERWREALEACQMAAG